MKKRFGAQQALKKSIRKNRKKNKNLDSPDSGSPSPGIELNKYELEEDLRTFEEKYMIINNDQILGEGCSSVVKTCILKDPDYVPQSDEKIREYNENDSSPLLAHNLSRITPEKKEYEPNLT